MQKEVRSWPHDISAVVEHEASTNEEAQSGPPDVLVVVEQVKMRAGLSDLPVVIIPLETQISHSTSSVSCAFEPQWAETALVYNKTVTFMRYPLSVCE